MTDTTNALGRLERALRFCISEFEAEENNFLKGDAPEGILVGLRETKQALEIILAMREEVPEGLGATVNRCATKSVFSNWLIKDCQKLLKAAALVQKIGGK